MLCSLCQTTLSNKSNFEKHWKNQHKNIDNNALFNKLLLKNKRNRNILNNKNEEDNSDIKDGNMENKKDIGKKDNDKIINKKDIIKQKVVRRETPIKYLDKEVNTIAPKFEIINAF